MDFSLDDDHLALQAAVRRFCDGEYPATTRGEPQGAQHAQRRLAGMAELGLLGLTLNADYGGSALGAVETMLVAHELGRALDTGAWLANVVLAAQLLQDAAHPEQQSRWLPAIARGELQGALAFAEAHSRHDLARVKTSARRDGADWVLEGSKSLVLGGDTAQLLLVVARTGGALGAREGLTLFAVDANARGLARQTFRLLDGRGAAHLTLDGVRVDAGNVVGEPGAACALLERAVARANAALCAEAAGAMEAMLEQTTEHLRTRKQFGAPLAKFQSLQHAVADMAIALEQVKSMACVAAMAVESEDANERERLVAAAKTLTAQLARKAGLSAIQLHGAMGMTDECRISHYARRLIAGGALFGDASHHLQRFAAAAA